MSSIEYTSEERAAVRNDLSAIFVSLELSQSTWLVTSLSPGGGKRFCSLQLSCAQRRSESQSWRKGVVMYGRPLRS